MDKNLVIISLAIVYLVVFKAVNFKDLGEPKNPIIREHSMDCRKSSPFNIVFCKFVKFLDLELDFDCFSRELRFAELYLSLPLLAEREVSKFVIDQADANSIKPVVKCNSGILQRPSDHPETFQ